MIVTLVKSGNGIEMFRIVWNFNVSASKTSNFCQQVSKSKTSQVVLDSGLTSKNVLPRTDKVDNLLGCEHDRRYHQRTKVKSIFSKRTVKKLQLLFI